LYFGGLAEFNPKEADARANNLMNGLNYLNENFAIALIEGKAGILDLRKGESGEIEQAMPTVISPESFKLINAPLKVTIQRRGKAPQEKAVAEIWLEWLYRHQYSRGVCFAPGKTQAEVGDDRLNIWTGWQIPQGLEPIYEGTPEEACAKVLYHIRQVVCDGDKEVSDWLLWWLADMLQNPSQKPGSAVVLKGKKGAVKSVVADIMKRVIGSKYFLRVAKKGDLVGSFNAQLAGAILVNCEEAMFGGDIEANNTLKDLITSDTILVNQKFIPSFQIRSYSRFLFTTNSSFSHSTSEDERRYLFLDVADTFVGDHDYFDKLWGEIDGPGRRAFADFLYAMKRPDGVNLRNPPKTGAHQRLLAESLSVEERFFYNALLSGDNYPTDAVEEAAEVYLSDVKDDFERYLDDLNKRNSLKRSDNSFVPGAMQKFWGAEVVGRKTRRGKKETVYFVPSLKDARELAVMPLKDGGSLGLLPDTFAGEGEDD
jgi:hypothetical protein